MSRPNGGWRTGNAVRRQPLLIQLVIVCLLGGVFSVILGTALGLSSFRDVGYPDSATLLRVGELVHSGRLYPPIDKPPYLVTLYGPAFYVFLAIPYRLAEAAGVAPQVPVRLCLLGVFCGCLALIFLMARRLYGSRRMAGLSALFAVSLLPVASWTTQIRSDFLGVFFSLLSIYLFLLKEGTPGWAAAAVCAGVALLVKQTFVAVPVAMAGWLIYRRRYKESIFWAGAVALTAGGGYAVAWWREPLLWQHMAAIRHPIFEYREALNTIGTALSQPVVPFCMVAGLLILWKGPPERLLFLIYCFLSWAISVLTVPQAGGAINYFWEPLMASALLAGPGLSELQRKLRFTPLAVTAILGVLLVGWFFPLLHEDIGYVRERYAGMKTYRVRRAKWQAFASFVSGRRLLSTFPDITLLSALPEIPDPYLNRALALRGQWNSAKVVDQIDASQYDFIVIGQNDKIGWRGLRTWDDAMWAALKRTYRLACVFETMEIWLPSQRAGEILPGLSAIGCEAPTTHTLLDDGPSPR
jgi:hypothetical protein